MLIKIRDCHVRGERKPPLSKNQAFDDSKQNSIQIQKPGGEVESELQVALQSYRSYQV
jgi:hypothetical protein